MSGKETALTNRKENISVTRPSIEEINSSTDETQLEDAPEWHLEKYVEARSRIRMANSARRLWRERLSERERRILGDDFDLAFKNLGTAGMWAKLRGISQRRATLEVAHVLDFLTEQTRDALLKAHGEVLDPEEARSQAIDAGHLVLTSSPRTVHFRGSELPIDWTRYDCLWVFLFELARSGKAGQPVDRFDFGDEAYLRVVADRKSRICKIPGFPAELADLIRVVGNGSQQLFMPPDQIRVFEYFRDEVREWHP